MTGPPELPALCIRDRGNGFMKNFAFDIDVVDACNLSCPSCPQGNLDGHRPPLGYMEPELLRGIVAKAKAESTVTGISLFSWCEPLLHPRIHELVGIVRGAGIACHLSSNLNLLPDAEAVMAANPASFKVSASGFTQEVYGYSHRGGDIERVKKHMIELAEAKRRTGSKTRLFVNYHRYRHNLKEEPLMREFAAGLGFGFQPVWALMFPLEKILGQLEPDASRGPFTEQDQRLIGRLALPPGESFLITKKYQGEPCVLKDSQISLDSRGRVQLCCGVFDSGRFSIGSYLALPLDEIQRLREAHEMCRSCLRHGGHVYLVQGAPELDELALASIAPEDVDSLGLRQQLAWKRMKERLGKLYRRYLSGAIAPRRIAALEARLDRLLHLVSRAKRSG